MLLTAVNKKSIVFKLLIQVIKIDLYCLTSLKPFLH